MNIFITLSHRAIYVCVLLLCFGLKKSNAQVGIGTTSPEAELDITSTNAGVLLPRFALTSLTDITTVLNPNGPALAVSTLVFNDGTGGLTPAGFYYWNGSQWNLIANNNPVSGMQFYSFDTNNVSQPNIDNPRALDVIAGTNGIPDLSGSYTGDLTSVASFPTTNPASNSNGFIIRFVGTYEVQNEGNFAFNLNSDDGSRLYIDDVLIVENWFNQGATTRSGDVNLSQGKHKFEFWYYENSGGNVFTFSWGANPDGNTGIISASQFIKD